MIVLLLSAVAWAVDPPWFDGYVGVVAEDPANSAGVSAGGGVALGRAPFLLEARADAAALSSGSRLAVWPALRVQLRDADDPRWRPSFLAGVGLQVGQGSEELALLMGAVDIDLPAGDGWTRPRVGAWVEGTPQGTIRGGLRVGIVHRSGRSKALRTEASPMSVDQAAALAAARETEGASGAAPDTPGPWWDPEVCAWVETDPGHGWRPDDGAGVLARADGDAMAATGSGSSDAEPPVRQGWLVVVAEPGDVVRLPGLERSVGSGRAAKLRAPEGVVDVEVVGGGRTQSFEAAIADGYVLWLRAEPPEEVAVQFAAGSAVVDDADRVAAQALARNRGQFRLRLTGSFSPEGDQASNLDLARRRAEAVATLLREVGVPAGDVEVLEPTPPRAGLTAAEQRAVYVQPVPPEEAR